MKKEKIILSILITTVGIIVAIGIFYIYQSNKQINPSELKTISVNDPSPTPSSSLFLTIETPKDEEVVGVRSLRISGITIPNAKIIVLSENSEEAAVPKDDGSFSTDINLSTGENIIEISAVAPNGEIVKVKRIVSYSIENF